MPANAEKPQKFDRRYLLAREIDPEFKESFINAPAHLEFPTRNQWAFLHGVIGIDPGQERRVVRERSDFVFEDRLTGKESPLQPEDKELMIETAKYLGKLDPSTPLTLDQAYVVFWKALARINYPASLDAPLPGFDGEVSLGDRVESPINVEDEALGHVLRGELTDFCRSILTPRDFRVLNSLFALEGGKAMTLEELGQAEGGISRQRVLQLRERAFRRIRGNLRKKGQLQEWADMRTG